MPLKRRSYYLSCLQSELRKYALNAKDEDTRKDYWRMYYKALNAEHEVRAMVMDAEMRRLLDFAFPDGIPQSLRDFPDAPPDNLPQLPDDITPDDDDLPPHQKRLWD